MSAHDDFNCMAITGLPHLASTGDELYVFFCVTLMATMRAFIPQGDSDSLPKGSR